MRPIIVALLIICAGISAGIVWHQKRKPMPAADTGEVLVVTTTAKRQDLLFTITQTGVVAAKNSTPVIPELSGRIVQICENGIVVSAGEPLIHLDPTKAQEQLTDLTVRHQDAIRKQSEADAVSKARMKEMRLRLKQARDDLKSNERQQKMTLKQSADAITFHEAELKHRREDVEVKRRMAAKGLIAGTEVEREEAALKSAEFSLQREKSDYELKKTQAASEAEDRRRNISRTTRDMTRTRSWTERDVRMSGNEVENLQLQLDRAKADLAKTVISAPVGGLVILTPQGEGQGETRLQRIGDLVAQGRGVAEIVSLNRMQVKLEFNQAQIAGVKMGQAADVVIEALPDMVLKGKVTAIGQTARRPPIKGWSGASSTATFPVTIDLSPIDKSLIRPGMHANVSIVSRLIKDAVTIPSGCVFQSNGDSVVFIERNGSFLRIPVTPGESNGDYIAITHGLNVGEKVALNNLEASSSDTASSKEPNK